METMKALVWKEKGKVELCDRPMPRIEDPRDAIVRVTRASICSSDLHLIHGTVPRAREGVVLGHEFVGEVVEPGDRRYYAPTGKLYKVREGQGHVTQADWTPDLTPALWAVVDVAHAGTAEDPIPAARGMEYTYGLCYLDGEDGKVYRCERTDEAEGGKITLHYLPHELVGQYFTEVTD